MYVSENWPENDEVASWHELGETVEVCPECNQPVPDEATLEAALHYHAGDCAIGFDQFQAGR